jgi:hypothetical protein
MALVSTPPHKFLRPPYWYYRLQEQETSELRDSDCITPISNLDKIRPTVKDYNQADSHDQSYMRSFHARCAKNAMVRLHSNTSC